MAVYSPINKDELTSYIEQYDIGTLLNFEDILEGVENTNYKIITTKNCYILTIFEKRVKTKDLPFFINLKKHLSLKKFKCPQPISNKKGKYINILKNKSCIIISYLQGSKILKVKNQHCFQIGNILALFHKETQDFINTRNNTMSYSKWENIFTKCNEFTNNQYIDIMPAIEKELIYLKNAWPKDLKKGIIHADVFQDNVFFLNDKFSGLIDFYFSCNDFLSYDIALTVNAWCFDNEFKFNSDRFISFIKGYEGSRRLTKDEKNYLSILCRGAAIRILLTRIHDKIFHHEGAFVQPKNPNEYLTILKFHQEKNIVDYIK